MTGIFAPIVFAAAGLAVLLVAAVAMALAGAWRSRRTRQDPPGEAPPAPYVPRQRDWERLTGLYEITPPPPDRTDEGDPR